MSGAGGVEEPRRGPRGLLWRTLLSALAGGGISVASLGGPVGVAAAEAPTETTSTSETTTAPTETSTSTTPETPAEPPATSTQPSTPDTTTTSATSTPSAPAPAPSPASTTTPTTTKPGSSSGASHEAPRVLVKRRQQASTGASAGGGGQASGGSAAEQEQAEKAAEKAAGKGNVALPPQVVAGQASALAAALSGAAASTQALGFYRIPLFLLPIYQAAAAQYDVPWQVLAAINEVETDYGTDLSVSSAGAEGWMQFMPQTWLEYGVDALNAGYADPYNPVDAIFAAARYLNAAGAAQNLDQAILAYNHSEAYLSSVLLRAKLIAAYPDQVIATLTGLVDDRPPVTGKRIGWGAAAPLTPLPSHSSATAGASTAANGPLVASAKAARAPSPAAAAAGAGGGQARYVDVTSEPRAKVVAVQDGRIVKLGHSHALGRYVILQDLYGDTFTYADLGSIAASFLPSRAQAAAQDVATGDKRGRGQAVAGTSSGGGKVRVFAHPGNPDAVAAAKAGGAGGRGDGRVALASGSVVPQGTVLGRVSTPPDAKDGHLRFAIKPVGDPSTIDPGAILANWTQLDTALHPQGVKGSPTLVGATASDVFLLSKSRLEREVLADPGIAMSGCSRQEVASGKIDRRILAALAFLSRSGLKPTVGTLACGGSAYATSGYVQPGHDGDGAAIVAINGVAIAGHQGAGTITDTTIRTLLTLQGQYFPAQVVSLMRYPGAPSTLARADHGSYIEIVYAPSHSRSTAAIPVHPHAAAGGHGAKAAAAKAAKAAVAAGVVGGLSAAQWEGLISRAGALPAPKIAAKKSSAAIPDAKR
ncbi:MAG TPA: lytic murein transglycosylase [Solirubrobacteraceae bacterium]|nr:lytic murein transglycosylase [Solirubrobacteraceae bacterium]